MDDRDRETMESTTAEVCDAFMRRLGEKYPWLHPDYDPDRMVWMVRRHLAERRMLRDRPLRKQRTYL